LGLGDTLRVAVGFLIVRVMRASDSHPLEFGKLGAGKMVSVADGGAVSRVWAAGSMGGAGGEDEGEKGGQVFHTADDTRFGTWDVAREMRVGGQ
jgi:hypothetical protein